MPRSCHSRSQAYKDNGKSSWGLEGVGGREGGHMDPTQTPHQQPPPPQTLVLLYPYHSTWRRKNSPFSCNNVEQSMDLHSRVSHFCSLLYKEPILIKAPQFWVWPFFMWRELDLCHTNKWHSNEPWPFLTASVLQESQIWSHLRKKKKNNQVW